MDLWNISNNVDQAIMKVNDMLGEGFDWIFESSSLEQSTFHLLKNKGKLLRPSLVFIGAEAIDKDPKELVDLALAIEYLHISSLIHDDIIDKDVIRRGMEAVHAKYGVEDAILAGDALISRAVFLASGFGERVVKEISKSAFQMCDGESLDFNVQKGAVDLKMDNYLTIALKKTASLISTSLSIASIYFGKSPETIARLKEAGEKLGIAFQIRDDIINFIGSKNLGRRPGNGDEINHRPNVCSIIMKNGFSRVESAIEALEMMVRYVNEAKEQLKGFTRISELNRFIDEFFDPKYIRAEIFS